MIYFVKMRDLLHCTLCMGREVLRVGGFCCFWRGVSFISLLLCIRYSLILEVEQTDSGMFCHDCSCVPPFPQFLALAFFSFVCLEAESCRKCHVNNCSML